MDGQRHRNDDPDCPSMVQPLIELSQDCVVEWNESQPSVGLVSTPTTTSSRSPSKSPTSRSPWSSRRGRNRSGSAGGAGTVGGPTVSALDLSHVRRKLEDHEESTEPTTKSRGSTEQELDTIFSLLEQDGLSPNCATQRTHNHHIQHYQQHDSCRRPLSDLYRNRPVVSSLASRRQRQRRRPREGTDDTATTTTMTMNGRSFQGSNSTKRIHRELMPVWQPPPLQPCPTTPPNHSILGPTSGGAFDSLLKELQQPQPTTWDKENPSPILSSPKPHFTNSPRATLKKPNFAATDANDFPKRPPLQNVTLAAPPVRIEQPHTNKKTSPCKPQETDEFGDFDFDVDMSCVDQLLAARTSAATTTIGTTSTGTVVHENGPPTVAPPPPALSASSQNCREPSMPPMLSDGDEDEFGDFPDVDLDLLDQVSKLRSNNICQQTLPPPKSQQPTALQIPPTVSSNPTTNIELTVQAQEVDEFGDFPDFDLSIIDQAIATRSIQPTTSTTVMADPLATDVVRNQRYPSIDRSGLSFIKFSRYRVLKIQVDSARFYKTILVAAWTDQMLQDDQAEINIHQNYQVEQRAQDGSLYKSALPPKNTHYPEAGQLQLRGQWYYTDLQEGDSIHICSLTGRYRTDPAALPIVLHSHPPVGSEQDDLVIIHHPDLLMTPTVICETVSCPRRAVLKQRNGSTGLTTKSALIGTLRHALFGWCIKERNFEQPFVQQQIKTIVRENAEAMVGCGVTTKEAEMHLLETVPVILDFVKEHTTLLSPNQATMPPHAFVQGHIGSDKGVRFAAHATYSLEEPVVSTELALKGFVDAVLETTTMAVGNENDRNQHTITGLKHSLMALELKTGHNQTSQHTHMGQLSLYTLMLQGRYGSKLGSDMASSIPSRTTGKPDPEGAASGGLLLYLNQQASKATHVAPEFDEFKSLIGQRNITASELLKASAPRGIVLAYEEDKSEQDREANKKVFLLEPAQPVQLPDVQQSERPCTRCFESRTCMLYARSETEVDDRAGVRRTHGKLLAQFTGQLQGDDLEYFRKWDRLIDLEAHATVGNTATAWLVDSHILEKTSGETISSLVYKGTSRSPEGSGVLLHFTRGPLPLGQTMLDRLSIGIGSHVVVSTDGTIFDDSQSDSKFQYLNTQRERKIFRQRMNVVRGFLKVATAAEVVLSANQEDLDRIQDIYDRFSKLSLDDEGEGDSPLLFRVDKENSAVGIGTLRQNLINLFTADARKSDEDSTPWEVATQRRMPRLRNFVVRLEPPSFRKINDSTLFQPMGPPIPGCDPQILSQEFQSLNQDQQEAVRKVVGMNDYTLIQGLPGTGKTSTLAFIARLLATRGKRVLITSYTNAAVDNVVIKLTESGVCADDPSHGFSRVVRIGPRHSCHEDARSVHVHDIAANMDAMANCGMSPHLLQASAHLPSTESLSRVISGARIVCSTVLTVPRSPLLVHESFDVVIVDEAGQTSQPAVLGALMVANSFVLVGDHKQLPPLVSSEIAQAGGYGESLLMRLAKAHPSSIAALTFQYRMNEDICQLSSLLTYDGVLKCGNDMVSQRRLALPGFPDALPPIAARTKGLWPWLRMTISPAKPVIFVDTDSMRTTPSSNGNESRPMEGLEEKRGGRAGGRVTNPTEAIVVRYIIQGLVAAGLPPKDIGVISPFRAQVHLLEENQAMVEWKKAGLEISTIDRYQGRDKPTIILSFVRSNAEGKVGRLLQDKRRLNVALTRAKSKLILVGSYSTLKTGSIPLGPLLNRIDSKQQRQLLPENALQCYQFP